MRPPLSLVLTMSALTLPARASNTTCSTFPTYNTTTQTTSPFTLVAASPTAPINGTAVSFVSFTNDGTDRYGFVTLPYSAPTFGTAPPLTLRCAASTLYAQLRSGDDWVPVSIAVDENWQRGLSFGLGEGVGVRAYVRGGDVYLGAEGSQGVDTRWAFKSNWGGNAGQYYLVRWAGDAEGKRQAGGEPPVVDDRDWVGELRVVGV